MTTRDVVSVIIPAYNCGEFVCEAVDSALAQTYPNVEVIVVDSSTDDTRERLAKYGDSIRYFYQPPSGLSSARNLAVRHAQGEWIALLDADDVWHPQKTEVQLRAAASLTECALVGSASAKSLPPMLELHPETRPLSVADFLMSTPIGPSGTILRREALIAAGLFNESLAFVEDREMWLRLAAQYRCCYVDSPCWWYRLREGQMSRNAQGNYECYHRVLTAFFEQHIEYRHLAKAAWSHFYADCAWSNFEAGNRGAALRLAARSFWLHPTGYERQPPGQRWVRAKSAVRYLCGARLPRPTDVEAAKHR